MKNMSQKIILLLAILATSFTLASCADMKMGKRSYQQGDYTAARRHYAPLAEFGLPDAQSAYAQMLLKGQGGPVEVVKARKLLELASDQGDTRSKMDLARLYRDGVGGPANPVAARRLLEEVAAVDYDRASLDLADAYYHGVGGDANTEGALKIYQAAADAGNARAMYRLAEIAESHDKINDAFALYMKAFNNGAPKAARQIGALYERKMTPPQYDLAMKWYKIAQQQNVSGINDNIERLNRHKEKEHIRKIRNAQRAEKTRITAERREKVKHVKE